MMLPPRSSMCGTRARAQENTFEIYVHAGLQPCSILLGDRVRIAIPDVVVKNVDAPELVDDCAWPRATVLRWSHSGKRTLR